jgi:hypothetical protein
MNSGDFYERIGRTTVRYSSTIAALAAALVEAQSELKNPPKDSINPHFKSRYADLATVRDTVAPVLNRHGLAVLQLPCETPEGPALASILIHKSGEWFETTFLLRAQQQTPQGVGSALTYCRRYALQSIAGVAADDDDDGGAGSRPATQPKPKPAPAPLAVTTPQPEPPKPTAAPAPNAAEKAAKAISAAPAPSGDPVTDTAALIALLYAKGWDWARLVSDVNAKFGTSYTLTGAWSKWEEKHRTAAVASLRNRPDHNSAADLSALLSQLAKKLGADPAPVFQRYAAAASLPESCIKPEDLSAEQLETACKSFRAKLESLPAQEKGGAK